jgi:GT2 family glycosyltransferase
MAENQTVKISIVIVSYKSDTVLQDCLFSIEKYSDLPYKEIEVIIVDNYIDSSLNCIISDLKSKLSYNIKYALNEVNCGFGHANNIGVSLSSGDVILFLNPDTILVESFFKETLERLQKDSNLIIGYTLVNKLLQLNNTYSIFPQYYIFNILFFFIKKTCFYLPNKLSVLNKMIWPWGAAFSMQKQLFQVAGGFDECIFLCNEEPDLLIRIPNRRINILEKKIIHVEGHTTNLEIRRNIEYLKSSHYYFRKYNYNWKHFLYYMKFNFKICTFFQIKTYKNTLYKAIKIYESQCKK